MEKEKIRNVKVSKGLAKLIGTAILVDSLIVGVFALGGHVPFHQDTKKINEVVETKTTEKANTKEIESMVNSKISDSQLYDIIVNKLILDFFINENIQEKDNECKNPSPYNYNFFL